MTPAEVVAWADKHYRPVLNKFGDDPPDGLTLSKLKEQNFKDAYGPTVGPAFYNTLVEEGTPLLPFQSLVSAFLTSSSVRFRLLFFDDQLSWSIPAELSHREPSVVHRLRLLFYALAFSVPSSLAGAALSLSFCASRLNSSLVISAPDGRICCSLLTGSSREQACSHHQRPSLPLRPTP